MGQIQGISEVDRWWWWGGETGEEVNAWVDCYRERDRMKEDKSDEGERKREKKKKKATQKYFNLDPS